MENKRIEWIDWCKGFGILAVMLAHAPVPYSIYKYISTFAIPLFFFISGYLFSTTKYNNFWTFVKKKVKSLLVPYITFSLINFTFLFVLSLMNKFPAENLYRAFLGILFLARVEYWNSATNALWFLICLFVTEVIFYIIVKLTKNSRKAIGSMIIILSIMGYLYGVFIKVRLPLCMDIWMTTIVFYGVAYIMKEKLALVKVYPMFIVILTVLNVFTGTINKGIGIYENIYGNYFLFYLSAFSGVLAIIMFFNLIKRARLIKFIGENTMVYLGMHYLIVYRLIGTLLSRALKHANLNFLTSLAIGMLYLVLTIAILFPVIYIANKKFPYIVGKKGKSEILMVS